MNSDKMKVAIVEPSRVIRDGLVSLFSGSPDFEVVLSAGDMLPEYATRQFDALVLDPSTVDYRKRNLVRGVLLNGSSIALVAVLVASAPQSELSQYDASFSVYDTADDILSLVRDAASKKNDAEEASSAASDELSDREKEILSAVAKGLSNKEIADKLFISVNTVITHRKNISRKLGINSIAGLTVYAIINHIVDPYR